MKQSKWRDNIMLAAHTSGGNKIENMNESERDRDNADTVYTIHYWLSMHELTNGNGSDEYEPEKKKIVF